MSRKPDSHKGKTARLRNGSRLSAVQALYQMELTGQGWKAIVQQFQNHRFGHDGEADHLIEVDEDYFSGIVEGVVDTQSRVDNEISSRLDSKWRLDRLDVTLRAIMRAGAYEILMRPDTPSRVVIDEYVELCKDFFDGAEPKFVNAALDRLARDIRPFEFKG